MKDYFELREDFRRQRMSFIHVELEAGLTFAQVAHTERKAGNEERALRNIGHAKEAYAEAERRLKECQRAENPGPFDAAQKKLEKLGAVITDLSGP